jgi:hypothetical protein
MIFKNSTSTSQKTRYISITKTNQLMLFREKIYFYSNDHTEHINALCGRNVEFLMVNYVVYVVTIVL